ncbi:hypothetical protein DPMN_157794 [Dreissena polymorpha]|uniref:Uncharacterized protein n=1 Tax=Dreissena polymorpha TaxID=45954 RepID=A0A9D4EL19_DREPO|nr:hypothetical protein DPMN_157794 [Dreissena polymorpha]
MKVDNSTDSKDRTPNPVSTVLTTDDDIDLTQSQSQSLISGEVPNTRKNNKKTVTTRVTKPKRQTQSTTPNSTPVAQTKGKRNNKKRRLSDSETQENESTPSRIAENVCIVTALNKLTDQMRASFESLSNRIEQLETSIDNIIKTQVQTEVGQAISKIKTNLNKELTKIRDNVKHASANATRRYNNENTQREYDSEISTLDIVIRNLPDSREENTLHKVNTLLKDGLLLNVKAVAAERKTVKSNYEHGIIIAKCKNKDELDNILKAKVSLKHNRTYSKVFIEKSRTRSEREAISNLATIANLIGKDKVTLRGNKLVPRHDADNRNDSWRKYDETHIDTLPVEQTPTNTDKQTLLNKQVRDMGPVGVTTVATPETEE